MIPLKQLKEALEVNGIPAGIASYIVSVASTLGIASEQWRKVKKFHRTGQGETDIERLFHSVVVKAVEAHEKNVLRPMEQRAYAIAVTDYGISPVKAAQMFRLNAPEAEQPKPEAEPVKPVEQPTPAKVNGKQAAQPAA